MNSILVRIVLGLLILSSFAAAQEHAPWAQSLYLANEGYWRQRLRIVVRNDRELPLAGEIVEIRVGKGDGQVDIAGAAADALRVVDEAGNELLWAIAAPNGEGVRRGPIPAGSTLHVPVDCGAKSEVPLWLYFDNAAAWAVPDFLDPPQSLRNGGMEDGAGDTPAAWKHDAADEGHRASWVEERPHAGRKCLKTVVAAGAEPTWISTRQSRIRIMGGARYVMRGWVRASEVQGFAGWYIHVGNARNAMQIGPMLDAGGGNYDWKEVRAEFTAPKDADIADLGTVLRGTGTAWFDDVSLECLDGAQPGLAVRVGKVERLEGLHEVNADAPWPKDAGWDYRVPVRVLSLPGRPAEGLIGVDLAGAQARLSGRIDSGAQRVMDGASEVACYRLGRMLLFEGKVEPNTRRTFHVYFRAGNARVAGETAPVEYAANPALPGGGMEQAERGVSREDYQRLLASPANLLKNPSFETGEKLPEHWSGGAKGQRPEFAGMELAGPGLFGQRAARIAYPADAKPQWVGWRQDAPVLPNRSYLLAAWLKCEGLAGPLLVHAHFHNAKGELCRDQKMTSAGPAITGTTDWTLLQTLLTMPTDIAKLQVHLTMEARGTAWHDGAVLVPVTSARAGIVESRAAVALSKPSAWAVNAIVKVFREDGPPAQTPPVRMTAARNDSEPLQIALRSPTALGQVKVTVDAPTNAVGQKLAEVSVGVVGYVPVDYPTSYYSSTSASWYRKVPKDPPRSDGWPGFWPDPILPRDTFDLPAHTTQPVWITVRVPRDAAAGDYAGKVRFGAAGTAAAEVPFTLRVWDFAVPEEMNIKAIYDCRPNSKLWGQPGKTQEQLRRDMWRFMAERRMCPDTIHPAPTLRYENGKVVADFTAFDEAAEYYFNKLKFPHAYTPHTFYAFGWGHPPSDRFGQKPYEGQRPFDGADRRKLRPEYKLAYQACLKAYWEHLKAKGWDRKVVLYISDEPFDREAPIREQMKALCEMIHEVDPAIPIYCSTWHHQPEWDGFLDVWGVGHYGIVAVEKLAAIRKSGAKFWWTTDGHMCIDTPYCAVERLLPHYCFKYGAEAYEFWGIDWLTYDPWQYGWHRYIHQSDTPGKSYFVRYPAGDGYLAYPGGPIGHDGPVTTVRLEQAREGCEDYEYLHLLRQRIEAAKAKGRDTSDAAKALAQAQELVSIPNAGGVQSSRVLANPDAVLVVKERVARAIETLK